MRRFLLAATSSFALFGIVQSATAAPQCKLDLYACIAESYGHPHICDPLVRNLPSCIEGEKNGEAPKLTKADIDALYKYPSDTNSVPWKSKPGQLKLKAWYGHGEQAN